MIDPGMKDMQMRVETRCNDVALVAEDVKAGYGKRKFFSASLWH